MNGPKKSASVVGRRLRRYLGALLATGFGAAWWSFVPPASKAEAAPAIEVTVPAKRVARARPRTVRPSTIAQPPTVSTSPSLQPMPHHQPVRTRRAAVPTSVQSVPTWAQPPAEPPHEVDEPRVDVPPSDQRFAKPPPDMVPSSDEVPAQPFARPPRVVPPRVDVPQVKIPPRVVPPRVVPPRVEEPPRVVTPPVAEPTANPPVPVYEPQVIDDPPQLPPIRFPPIRTRRS
jgi:hypothetical protein